MSESSPATGTESSAESHAAGHLALDRIFSFRIVYISIAVFLLLYIFTVKAAEILLERHFAAAVLEAIQIDDFFLPPVQQINSNIDLLVNQSNWVQIGDVRVNVTVLARDGITWLYVGGHTPPPSPEIGVQANMREAQRLLPASGETVVSVPHNTILANSILIFYAAALFQVLFAHNRRVARRESQVLADALSLRDAAARRAEGIQDEIDHIREQLLAVEPAEREQQEEISTLQSERRALELQLATLASRERDLRSKADQAVSLQQERTALEDLLEEASSDLSAKDGEIRDLERSLKRATKLAGGASGRSREGESLEKRLRTLYRNIEIDDRAVQDLVSLRDENTKLRAEECIKRLSEEADNVTVRRKIGGLPNHLSIYEMGFAGKRRIYYMRGQQRRFRILIVGAKNTQQGDLDYLARISKDEVAGAS